MTVPSLRTAAAGVAALALLLAWSVRADAQGLPIGWSWQSSGDELTVTVQAFDIIEGVSVRVRRHSDRRTFDFTLGDMALDQVAELDMPFPTRTSDYTITLTGTFAGIPGTVEDQFEIAVLEPMDFTLDTSTFDEAARRFEITMTQPAGSVEVLVRGESGDVLADRVIPFAGEPPGTRLPITWTQRDETILTIDVKAVGASGAWRSQQFVPWSVQFAAYVNFPTASWEIPEADMPMLHGHLEEIQASAARVAEWVECKLYIAGYTDTVGSDADNQLLSERRARSIGRFFREHGVQMDIYYQGFGEEALAVQTADNVDEPQNRRSIFILDAQAPTGVNIPRSNWRALD